MENKRVVQMNREPKQELRMIWSDILAKEVYQLIKYDEITNGGGFKEWCWKLYGYGNKEWAIRQAKHYDITLPEKVVYDQYQSKDFFELMLLSRKN